MFSKEEFADFIKEYNKETDMVFIMNEVEGHGREEGRVEGRNEGIKENQKKTARKMLKDGLNLDMIKKYTGLSKSVIKTLM